MRFRGLALTILFALYPLTCIADPCADGIEPNGQIIELSGVLHSDVYWGPPNFGENPETDSTFTAWTISLSEPLFIIGGAQIGDEFEPSVSDIQLGIPLEMVNSEHLRLLDRKLVVATGKLWRGIAQGDVLPIGLDIETAEALKPTDHTICRITSAVAHQD
jgi:hypothetical protein